LKRKGRIGEAMRHSTGDIAPPVSDGERETEEKVFVKMNGRKSEVRNKRAWILGVDGE